MSTKSLPRCLSDWPIPAEFYAKPKPWLEVIVRRLRVPRNTGRSYRTWLGREAFDDYVSSGLFTIIVLREVDQKP